tara:strand:+ start:1632 stop:2471 length:840 start_codon:yes stop_codon:yes gene_type:complete
MNKLPEYIHERMGGQLHEGQVAKYVIVPGSQTRINKIVSHWDDNKKLAHHYEFLVHSGTINGQGITTCSTGIGGRSTSIAIDEMAALGANTFIRIGVTGGIQPNMQVGDLVIASGAVRMDKTSEHYVFPEYPAVADMEVTCALIAAAQLEGCNYHVGIGATASSFYAGQGITCLNGYRTTKMDAIVSDIKSANVYDWDTETATIFTLCNLYGLRAGRVNVIVDDPNTGLYNPAGEDDAVKVVTEAVKLLMKWDKIKQANNQDVMLPDHPGITYKTQGNS